MDTAGRDALQKALEPWYSEQEIGELFAILRQPPLETAVRVNTLLASPDVAKSSLQAHFDKTDSGFVVDNHPSVPDVLLIRPKGPFQVTPQRTEALVDLACAHAVLRGADIFAKGIVALEEQAAIGDLVAIWADVRGKCCKGAKRPFEGDKCFIGNGRLLMDRKMLFGPDAVETGLAIKMEEMQYILPSLNGVMTDTIFPQNLPSALVGHLLEPLPGQIVIDMCASPGGKTTHMSALMKNTGLILAFDQSRKKVAAIEENILRQRITNVVTAACDSTTMADAQNGVTPQEFVTQLQTNGAISPLCFACADRIILDPPCSGLGQRPMLSFKDGLRQLGTHSTFQEKLFHVAWSLLKPGGTIVYSTCTLYPFENECLIAKMLARYPDACLCPVDIAPGMGMSALKVPGLTAEQAAKMRRFWPFRPSCDTIGFFIAKLTKQAPASNHT